MRFNRFAYVNGDPINYVDPSGLNPDEVNVTAAERAQEAARQRALRSPDGHAEWSDGEANHGAVVVVSGAQEVAASGAHGNARMSATEVSATAPSTASPGHRTPDTFDRAIWDGIFETGKAIGEMAASMVPGVGEAMDVAVLADSGEPLWARALAGGSLLLSAVTFGLSPNIVAVLRGGRRLASIGDDAAGAARRLADDGVEAAGRLGDDAVDLAADACPAGHCSCFVAGTLIATAILTGAVPVSAQADPPPDIVSYEASAENELILDHRAIEELQVGDRVITMPGLRGETDSRTAVTDEWQVIDLEVIARSTDASSQSGVNAERVVVLTVLRPPGWLASQDPDGDGAFLLELPELRLAGLAHVVVVRGPPEVEESAGRVVLSTVEHLADETLRIRFEESAVLETTRNHPFYRMTDAGDGGWVPAGELAIGDFVDTPQGGARVAALEIVQAPMAVFNLEVEHDHEYLVGREAYRVHNTYDHLRRAGEVWRTGRQWAQRTEKSRNALSRPSEDMKVADTISSIVP